MKHPTVAEVAAYWTESSLHGSAEEFHDHFESNGWIVGRVPMKNWQAAARNWSRNESKFNGRRGPSQAEVLQFNKLMAGKSATEYLHVYRQRFGCDPEGI